MRLEKPWLPEWRYWPALAFAGFLALAAVGWSFEPPTQKQPDSTSRKEEWNPISETLAFVSAVKADQWIALFTGLTGVIFLFQFLAMRRENEHFRVTERAYIKLSHRSPGVRWPPQHGDDHFDVTIRAQNHGSTPGRTIGFFMTGRVVTSLQELHSKPIYGSRQLMGAFLVAEDKTFISQPFILGQGDGEEVRDGRKILVVYGFIDYEDQFKTIHRAGYARVYDHRCDIRPTGPTNMVSDEKWAERNNLLFLETPHTYNFDLPLSDEAWVNA